MKNTKNAIVLCSGGLDSVVTASFVKKSLSYDKIKILFFDYGQKTLLQERKASKYCAKVVNGEFIEIKLKWLNEISNSLINKSGKVKTKQLSRKDLKDTKKESDKYYVPCRNTIFLVHALALAESLYIKSKKRDINEIFIGFKCEGKESYPDTTQEFVEEMNKLSKISCNKHFRIIAPLIKKDKEDIVLLGKKLGVEMEKTWSCYVGNNPTRQCGKCLACMLRKEGFYWANVKDRTRYES
ncbi:MAG: 7-cyano-7-deazaguanine synthase [Candidatus Pacearchaeota archaeon]|jgi:7-cyano-7-deazaguanine synthase